METSLRIITPGTDETLLTTVERSLSQPPVDLTALPGLTSVVLSDPYLAQQLVSLHQAYEIQPPPARGLLARLRTRLAWWLLGSELRQANYVHADLVRIIDSLLVHLDQERVSRRRLETHLASLHAVAHEQYVDNTMVRDLPGATESLTADNVEVIWHSSFAPLTGYSNSARAFVLGLDARGVKVRPLFLYGSDHNEQVMMETLHPRLRYLQLQRLRLDIPQVVYAAGDCFSKNSGSYRIGFTMLEVDRLPASWVEQANQMDEIWTPTTWGKEVFHTSGVQRPIYVVPLGVDPAYFFPGELRTQLRERTIFVSVFEWGKRKGWDILLQAYRKAFRPTDPVLLLLKIDAREPAVNPIQELASKLPAGNSPPVHLIYNQKLPLERLTELYRGTDCFVLPSRGEGWGMPILEAMSCGIPAIATNWSGTTAFLHEANGYPLPWHSLVPTGLEAPHYRDARWAEPDVSALVELLRHVAANPAERQQKGAQAALDARQWTWERAVDAVYQRLATI
jgi:glycosyltransferase involved in cell wall biosynthesis